MPALAAHSSLTLPVQSQSGLWLGSWVNPIPRDQIVDQQDLLVLANPDPLTSVAVNGVVDDGMGSTLASFEAEAMLSVPVDEIVDNQGIGVVSADENPAETLGGPVAENAVALNVDRVVLLLGTICQNDGLATGIGNRQSTDGDKLRRLNRDGIAFCALLTGAAEHHAPSRGGWISLDNDTVGFGRCRSIVLALDDEGFVILACLDADDIARLGSVNRSLNRWIAGRVTVTGRIAVVDVVRRMRRRLRKCQRHECKRDNDKQTNDCSPAHASPFLAGDSSP